MLSLLFLYSLAWLSPYTLNRKPGLNMQEISVFQLIGTETVQFLYDLGFVLPLLHFFQCLGPIIFFLQAFITNFVYSFHFYRSLCPV